MFIIVELYLPDWPGEGGAGAVADQGNGSAAVGSLVDGQGGNILTDFPLDPQ